MSLHPLLEPPSPRTPAPPLVAGRLRAHLGLMRLDHSVKQIFVTPGILLAMVLSNTHLSPALFLRFVLGLVALTLVASSNYVLNELLDAPFDRMHPTKCLRPAACGRIHERLAWFQWLLVGIAGLILAASIAEGLLFSCLALWLMGCVYNIAPVRTKDIPYLDVLSESINNPLRFLAGWYMVTTTLTPPMSMLISYWMIGAYFMSLKRFSEYREIGPEVARLYRRSFEVYTPEVAAELGGVLRVGQHALLRGLHHAATGWSWFLRFP